jgi:Putative regulator of cell autolysis
MTVPGLDVSLDPSRIARWLLLIVGVSLLIGTFLFHLFVGLNRLPEQWPDLVWNVYFSILYTTIMSGSLLGTISWLRPRVPLHSRKAVALHVSTLSAVAAIAYSLVTVLCETLHPSIFGMRWEVLFVTATIAFTVTLIWSAFVYLGAFYRQMREAEAARYEARLEALRAQINPHFLFNAFNSIAALVRTRPEKAEAVVEDLSDLFRYALQSSKDDAATLEQEVQAARRYLAVEKARFRDRLDVRIDVPEALRSTRLPSMTLQPLVENAVQHGVGETQKGCTITIAAERTDDTLCLRVLDTGPGFDTADLDAVLDEGTGLANVQERLRIFYDTEAGLTLRPQGVEVRLPLDWEPADIPRMKERAASAKS